ncbi:TetR family transcriptional regulator C-terminal domain-containing protein [Streptosporangium amethystogenes subsp. fukuiense]|uniref:TetR family transcriptional regulator C-terminal domain-containing protein n=1 Tax=Streptosporangium amethystogenes subsp. fukuiense TaxID=698418 RepID=A0ABW2T7C9_9ACTN
MPGGDRAHPLVQPQRCGPERLKLGDGRGDVHEAGAEFDARPGRIPDLLARARRDRLRLYEQTVRDAQQLGRLDAEVDPAQPTFELGRAAARRHLGVRPFAHRDPCPAARPGHPAGRGSLTTPQRGPVRVT